ncbi:MAG TPA: NAD(P)H-hydrate dehydratase [Terricaulis sp.]|nr:NAD(P)H-hydrate dehydratase [Terricaulis sp.]
MSGEIITIAQMRAIDAAAAAGGTPTRVLMENAGRAVAEAIMRRWSARRAAVLCGPGDNGGDGWVAARLLRDAGWPVWVESLAERSALKGAAAEAAGGWDGDIYPLGEGPPAEMSVDALFGAGLSRPLEGVCAQLAAALPAARVVAVDTPSGLHGDSGKPLGDACFKAALTITFVRKKPAHVLEPGRSFCGEIVVADIGVPETLIAAEAPQLWEGDWDRWRATYPWPARGAHKHARGHVVAASGGAGRTGAARLAAHAALRVGAGLVTVLSPPEAMAENAAHLTAIMLREAADAGAYTRAMANAHAGVTGPAFGLERGETLKALLASPRPPCVLDADALTLLAPLSETLQAGDVLTPHVGEFNRLYPGLLDVSASRIEAARAAAQRAGCVVLLKGPDTIIAAPDGRAAVNASGTPFLATAGSGDVLAGLIAGLIAQGVGGFEAAGLAAWLHGRCGEALGPGLIAEDLAEALPKVLNSLAPEWLRARPEPPNRG